MNKNEVGLIPFNKKEIFNNTIQYMLNYYNYSKEELSNIIPLMNKEFYTCDSFGNRFNAYEYIISECLKYNSDLYIMEIFRDNNIKIDFSKGRVGDIIANYFKCKELSNSEKINFLNIIDYSKSDFLINLLKNEELISVFLEPIIERLYEGKINIFKTIFIDALNHESKNIYVEYLTNMLSSLEIPKELKTSYLNYNENKNNIWSSIFNNEKQLESYSIDDIITHLKDLVNSYGLDSNLQTDKTKLSPVMLFFNSFKNTNFSLNISSCIKIINFLGSCGTLNHKDAKGNNILDYFLSAITKKELSEKDIISVISSLYPFVNIDKLYKNNEAFEKAFLNKNKEGSIIYYGILYNKLHTQLKDLNIEESVISIITSDENDIETNYKNLKMFYDTNREESTNLLESYEL